MAVNGSAWAMLSRKNTAYNHSRVRFSVSAFSARVEPTELPRLRPSRPEAASTVPDEVAVAPASSAGIHRGGGGRYWTAAPAPGSASSRSVEPSRANFWLTLIPAPASTLSACSSSRRRAFVSSVFSKSAA